MLTYGETPEVSTDTWQLRVWGLAKEATFSWSDFMAMPLPPDHGGPMRLVVPHLLSSPPSLMRLLSSPPSALADALGLRDARLRDALEKWQMFWKRNGYHWRGEHWAEERYRLPSFPGSPWEWEVTRRPPLMIGRTFIT